MKNSFLVVASALVGLMAPRVALAAPASALVKDLPGLNMSEWEQPWKQYSGYIVVDDKSDRRLFYWLQEAQSANAADLPLILWQNGGPGCSSVGGGLMTEQGAFRPTASGDLSRNPWSWSREANVLYVESPAFVGFSYSNDKSDNTVGDARTADDLVQFILGFYSQYPEYAGRPLGLSGESYGGHYVPNLALAIVEHNAAVARGDAAGPTIPLFGLATGNAWTVAEIDNLGAVFDWWTHSLVSDECMSGISLTCNLTEVGPLDAPAAVGAAGTEFEAVLEMGKRLRPNAVAEGDCNYWQSRCSEEMGNVNIYEIYADVCLSQTDKRHPRLHHHEAAFLKALGWMPDPSAEGKARRLATGTSSNVPSGSARSYDPCVDDETATYLNRPDVQQALHVNTGGSIGRKWSDCSPTLDYSRKDLLTSMLPVYEKLLREKLHIYVFSGDVDGIVPVTGTRLWLDRLGVNVSANGRWRPWTDSAGQVGGYVTRYATGSPANLTFVSVRNAGHMVPTAQASRALDMIRSFLARGVPE